MGLFEILLLGLLLVAIYLIADAVTVRVERRRGRPLGAWRSGLFFAVFLGLWLAATALMAPFVPGAG